MWAIEPTTLSELLPTAENLLRGEGLGLLRSAPAHANPSGDQPGQAHASAAPATIYAAVGSDSTNSFRLGYYAGLDALPPGSIAVLPMRGVIMKYGFCSAGSMDRAALMLEAGAHPNVAGVLIDTDSGGGQANGLNTLHDAILRVRGEFNKPVIGLVNDGMAASAAYHTLSACTEIWATHSTCSIGSIGAVTMLRDSSEADARAGIKNMMVYASKSTRKHGTVRDALAGKQDALVAELDLLNDDFHARVLAQRPSLTEAELNGEMFGAEQALARQLIDRIGSLDEALNRVNELALASPASPAPLASGQDIADSFLSQPEHTPPTHTNMKYAAICALMGFPALATTAEGAHFNVEALDQLETALSERATQTATLSTAQASLATAQASLASQGTELSTAQEAIASLEAKILSNPAAAAPLKVTSKDGEADPAAKAELTEWEKLDAAMVEEASRQAKAFGY